MLRITLVARDLLIDGEVFLSLFPLWRCVPVLGWSESSTPTESYLMKVRRGTEGGRRHWSKQKGR